MIDRRRLLIGAGAAGLLSSAVPAVAVAETTSPGCVWPPLGWQQNGFPSRRWVNVLFVHTNERFNDIYLDDGVYIKPQIEQFSHVVRDFRANEWKLMHPNLMDIIFLLHWKYCRNEIRIFSGYRSEGTNTNIEGAAKNSQHIQARALDIHLDNVNNDEVARDFQNFIRGGIGMYPGQQFTHVDMGTLRHWVG